MRIFAEVPRGGGVKCNNCYEYDYRYIQTLNTCLLLTNRHCTFACCLSLATFRIKHPTNPTNPG